MRTNETLCAGGETPIGRQGVYKLRRREARRSFELGRCVKTFCEKNGLYFLGPSKLNSPSGVLNYSKE